MKNRISKSLEYNVSIQGIDYLVKVLVESAPEELEINNVDKEENEGFIYIVSVLTYPNLSRDIFDTTTDLIYVIGHGGVNRIGHLENSNLVELLETDFVRTLAVRVLEVLMLSGNRGHYTG